MSGLKTNVAISAIALSFALGAHATTEPPADNEVTVITEQDKVIETSVDPVTDAEGEVQTDIGEQSLEYWIDGDEEELDQEIEQETDDLPPPQIPATMVERRDTTTGPAEDEPEASEAYRETQAQYLEEVLQDSPVTGDSEVYEDLVEDNTSGDDELVDDDYEVDVTEDVNEDEDVVDPELN